MFPSLPRAPRGRIPGGRGLGPLGSPPLPARISQRSWATHAGPVGNSVSFSAFSYCLFLLHYQLSLPALFVCFVLFLPEALLALLYATATLTPRPPAKCARCPGDPVTHTSAQTAEPEPRTTRPLTLLVFLPLLCIRTGLLFSPPTLQTGKLRQQE